MFDPQLTIFSLIMLPIIATMVAVASVNAAAYRKRRKGLSDSAS